MVHMKFIMTSLSWTKFINPCVRTFDCSTPHLNFVVKCDDALAQFMMYKWLRCHHDNVQSSWWTYAMTALYITSSYSNVDWTTEFARELIYRQQRRKKLVPHNTKGCMNYPFIEEYLPPHKRTTLNSPWRRTTRLESIFRRTTTQHNS